MRSSNLLLHLSEVVVKLNFFYTLARPTDDVMVVFVLTFVPSNAISKPGNREPTICHERFELPVHGRFVHYDAFRNQRRS